MIQGIEAKKRRDKCRSIMTGFDVLITTLSAVPWRFVCFLGQGDVQRVLKTRDNT